MTRKRPPMPPHGPPDWIEKGFPPYKNPNWWQKIQNFIFTGNTGG